MGVATLHTPSLGDASYLFAHGASGIVIDPQRDLSRMLDLVERAEVAVTHVLDTHVHNDYLSGAPALAGRLGADLVLPAGSGAEFRFEPAFHLEDVEADGGVTIRPLHTPGHTPEHTSYLVLVDGVEQAVFSGGSLLVGTAGRADLLGHRVAAQLTRLQYRSVHRLASLPAHVGLYPTHGAGSFCTAATAGRDSSTIGRERRSNEALAYPDEEAFVSGQLSGLLPFPDYYGFMASLNRAGPEAAIEEPPPELDQAGFRRALADGAAVVDARPVERYAAGHAPGSLNVPPGSSFAPWVGWLVPFGTPVVLVLDPGEEAGWAAVELARIGYEVVGVVRDVPEPVVSRVADLDALEQALGEAPVIDVRDPAEWERGHLEGTVHGYVPDLRRGLPTEAGGEVWLVCASGYRSAIAAGLVERHGAIPVVVNGAGVPDLLARGVR